MQHEPKKIALFVDFDNIYLGLRETSREAAEAFATRPHVWLKWIEHGMPIGDVEHAAPRESRALIRQCYLNPDSFGKYRGYFTRAGFGVVDCPSLTSRGKNSSDIVMVMDILDALRHETRFDRFVIMSADADFTPVLQRLRAHDRRTAVMVSGLAAPAYRASCDKLIEEDVFIEHALELALAPEPPRATTIAPSVTSAAPSAPATTAIRDPELLAAIGRRVYEEASSSGTLPASELPRILREFKEFTPSSNWLGYFSLQSLTEAVLAHQPELRITDDDPWRIAVRLADEPPAAASDAAPPAVGHPHPDLEALRGRVVRLVARMVEEADEPVVMGRAAHAAIQEVGPLLTETRWLGKGTFKNLLLSAPELPFTLVASPLPGFVFDPERHQPPSERAAVDGLAELPPEMASLARRMNQLTDAPRLTPRQYRVMWEVIAKELARAPYNLMSTGKAVRDQCVERGEPIARQAVTWVLRGLGYVGYRFSDPQHTPENLATAYRGNLLNILRQAQVTLGEDELRTLDEWLMGGASDAPAPSAAAPPPASRRRAAPADPDAASEPDYAAWADALLAGASREDRPVSASGSDRELASADTSAPDPRSDEDDPWPPKDALLFEPMDTEAPPRREDADSAWPPKDALLFEPMDTEAPPRREDADSEWPPKDALLFEPRDAEPMPRGEDADSEWPPKDALLFEPMDAEPMPRREDADSEWRPKDALFFEPTHPEPLEDAVSIDEEPTGADLEPPAPAAGRGDALAPDASPSEPSPASRSPESDYPADDTVVGDSAPSIIQRGDADEQPVQPAVEGDSEADDDVSADWQQPATGFDSAEPDQFPWEVVSEGEPSQLESAPADSVDGPDEVVPAEPRPPSGAERESDIHTALWEPVDAAAEPPPPASAEPAVMNDAAADDAGAVDGVTPRRESVEEGSGEGGPPSAADFEPQPTTQMDAFPPERPHDAEPEPESAPEREERPWWG